jgi:HlyD family secretion protein
MNWTKKRALLVAAALAVGVAAVLVLRSDGDDPDWLSASGTVEATETQLGFQAPGRLSEIMVREGDQVAAGAELARLDLDDLLARWEQADAGHEAALALLAELEQGARPEEVAQARSGRDAARQRLMDAERELNRAVRLEEVGAISQQALEKARLNHEVSRSQYEQAQEQLGLVEAGPRAERIDAQRAQVRQAEAAVRWVRIYVSGDRIGAVQVGSPVIITADTYPDREYGGEVIHIASEAEFTPKNVQTREERVKLVYAVKVRVTDDPTFDLKPGMPADVRIGLAELDDSARQNAAGSGS